MGGLEITNGATEHGNMLYSEKGGHCERQGKIALEVKTNRWLIFERSESDSNDVCWTCIGQKKFLRKRSADLNRKVYDMVIHPTLTKAEGARLRERSAHDGLL